MIPIVLGVVALAVVAAAAGRRGIVRTIEREYADRFPPDEQGIAEGAGGFTLAGTNGCRLLLLHGSGDTPQSLRHLASRLNAAGYGVQALLLPGHGRSPRAFAEATADEYLEAVRRALEEFAASPGWIGVIGLSMGGALAAQVTAENARVGALVLLAPYVIPPRGVRVVRGLSWLWSPLAPYLRGRGEASVHDPVARDDSRAYGSFSAGALDALVATAGTGFRALPRVTVPTLVVNSEQDNRIPRALAQAALDTIKAPVEQHWLGGCGHVITVDYCKDAVADLVLAFLARHAG